MIRKAPPGPPSCGCCHEPQAAEERSSAVVANVLRKLSALCLGVLADQPVDATLPAQGELDPAAALALTGEGDRAAGARHAETGVLETDHERRRSPARRQRLEMHLTEFTVREVRLHRQPVAELADATRAGP